MTAVEIVYQPEINSLDCYFVKMFFKQKSKISKWLVYKNIRKAIISLAIFLITKKQEFLFPAFGCQSINNLKISMTKIQIFR